MSAALVLMLLAAEPVSVPMTVADPVEQLAPAPRWPAALFFTGGGSTMWAGVGLLLKGAFFNFCGRAPCANQGQMLAGTVIASVGVASLLAGIFWLVWTRSP